MIADAYRFILPILAAAAAFAYFGWPTTALVLVGLAGYVCYFFRNPRREPPVGEHLVVSPADGKVVAIEPIEAASPGMPDGHSVSIFLNIFNVHVNRSPLAGVLEAVEYKRGKFRAAFNPEASQVNEQNVLTIRSAGSPRASTGAADSAHRVVVRQIAGLIARRVICWRKPGERLTRVELFGLIRFGSRVDVLLPKEVTLRVKVGDRVKGGSSVLGEML